MYSMILLRPKTPNDFWSLATSWCSLRAVNLIYQECMHGFGHASMWLSAIVDYPPNMVTVCTNEQAMYDGWANRPLLDRATQICGAAKQLTDAYMCAAGLYHSFLFHAIRSSNFYQVPHWTAICSQESFAAPCFRYLVRVVPSHLQPMLWNETCKGLVGRTLRGCIFALSRFYYLAYDTWVHRSRNHDQHSCGAFHQAGAASVTDSTFLGWTPPRKGLPAHTLTHWCSHFVDANLYTPASTWLACVAGSMSAVDLLVDYSSVPTRIVQKHCSQLLDGKDGYPWTLKTRKQAAFICETTALNEKKSRHVAYFDTQANLTFEWPIFALE